MAGAIAEGIECAARRKAVCKSACSLTYAQGVLEELMRV